MSELHHECGIVAVYHWPNREASPLLPGNDPVLASRLVPRMLIDIQNRGQLAAGITAFNPARNQLIDTHKEVGAVAEVFHLNRQDAYEKLMQEYSGHAAIGHVRYATCGKDDRSYAQPFERHHIEKGKWFSFAFNGQLANYPELREEILSRTEFHLARENDTEILMHSICLELKGDRRPGIVEMLRDLSQKFDGAYNIVFLNAVGDMFVARDPLGIRPLCWAMDGSLFAAASESVALSNLGFPAESIHSLPPGHVITIQNGEFRISQFAPTPRSAHCFFEWIYFANVASTLDDRNVYLSRAALGQKLAKRETVPLDSDTIVVPVPDTAKAAAAAMAFELGLPCLEGLMRNRYVGRTFIEGKNRADKARTKYTPVPEVMRNKRVLLVEDTIVRSTTMRTLIRQLKTRGGAREVHVRVACPPIVAPCFYGIDMSTVKELFAPKFMQGHQLTPETEAAMANELGADSLKYLRIEDLAECVDKPAETLCQACVDGNYPTPAGRRLYQLAIENDSRASSGSSGTGRTYDVPTPAASGEAKCQ
jgi:amidophosphoribosyltransferase